MNPIYTIIKKKSRLKIILTLFLLLTFISIENLSAGQSLDTKGTDFWLTYLPNFHNSDNNLLDYYDSLYIFITSDIPTSGIIEYYDSSGQKYTQNFNITDVTQMYIFKVWYNTFELLGYNESGNIVNGIRNQSEMIAKQSFHVTSKDEVTVYAHDQAVLTSDAFLVLPTDILGDDYFVMSYNSDGTSTVRGINGQSTPSQFAIVATLDSTVITIMPTDETEYNGTNTQTITLNTGQVYLVQARISSGNLRSDLTGTEIHSTNPIAVFGGHQRARIPVNNSALNSRDCLIEEMSPTKSWGKNAFLTPYIQPAGETNIGTDLYRILSGYDNTEIQINDVLVTTLDKGEFYEGQLVNAAKVTASKPIMVAQFKKTSGTTNTTLPGDPFEMLIPPQEQFMNSYRVINVQAWEYNFFNDDYNPVYTEQYIGIVAPQDGLDSIFLDGFPLPKAGFKQIPTSNYYYANIKVQDGVHTANSKKNFGIYIYGYGSANSYGYIGGMSFRVIDFQPPQITFLDTCYSVQGVVYDTTITDSHIDFVQSPVQSQVNVNVNIENFTKYIPSVSFSASLKNIYEDGSFSIIAQDSVGLTSNHDFSIPGFTLSLLSYHNPDSLYYYNQLFRTGTTHCIPFVIENYGKFPRTVNQLSLKNGSNFTINYNTPKTLLPNQKDTLTICFSSPVDSSYIDTLLLANDCGVRNIMALKLDFMSDRNNPKITKSADPCDSKIQLVFTDSLPTDFGIESYQITDTVNCRITINEFLPKGIQFNVLPIDPYQNAIYKISATDSAGHISTISDTLPAFTLTAQGITAANPFYDFGNISIGDLKCDSIILYNYGLLPITLTDTRLTNNLIFSIPQTQFPFIIMPKESKPMILCFSPLTYDTNAVSDTLIFDLINCVNDSIPIIGRGDPMILTSNSNCNVPVKIIINDIPHYYYLDQNFPNPVMDFTKIRFGIPDDVLVKINLFDIYGNYLNTFVNEKLSAGVYEIKVDLSLYNQGPVIYQMQTDKQILSRFLLIIK